MTDHQSDAELHMERLVRIAFEPKITALDGLSLADRWQIYLARKEMARLMMALAVRLAGK